MRYLDEDSTHIEYEQDRSIGLGSTFDNGHIDRQTDRQAHTQTDIFSKTLLDCGSDVESKIIKKIEVEFLYDCNRPTSFTPNVARK